eukprot:TRINITY_DN106242_c0_g1_i1.p1 TRINITY_DN106242_c0_g1~~TRINITY_DN106242_c0_g1_i1.p1  ORF type:complete len:289 (-),score=32.12 TRINITY_DN106242_c0_g1_i1:74-940(-)
MTFFPEWTFGNSLATIWLLLNVLHYKKECVDPTPSSKFNNTAYKDLRAFAMVPGRVAWFVVNFPGLVHIYWYLAAERSTSAGQENGLRFLVIVLLAVHFTKRVFEVLFIHSFSVGENLIFVMIPGFLYCFNNWLWIQSIEYSPLGVVGQVRAAFGTVLFLLGEAGSFWHHAHLARLRARPPKDMPRVRRNTETSKQPLLSGDVSGKGDQIYVLPSGGLFNYVATPHWFCELVGFFGLSIVAWHLHAVLIPMGMTSFLAGKAVASTRWYKDKFGDKYPSSRRHLVPLVW